MVCVGGPNRYVCVRQRGAAVELLGRENARKAEVFADVAKKFDSAANAKAMGYRIEAIEAAGERTARLNFQQGWLAFQIAIDLWHRFSRPVTRK